LIPDARENANDFVVASVMLLCALIFIYFGN